MSSTKLIVLKSKELIYTAILLALVIVFVIILITMFRGKDSDDTSGSARSIAQTDPSPKLDEIHYTPGTYSSSLVLGENTLSVMVTVDEDYITDVSFKQVDETVTTMYPLLETALEDINTQLHYISSDITPSGDSTYTTRLIIDSIRNALKDAVIN